MEYTIKPGETLSKIAQSQGTTVNALQQANNIQNPNLIQAGAKLAIPSISAENINTKQAIIPTVQPPKTDLNAFVTSVGQNVQPLQTDVTNAEKGVSTAQSDLQTLSKQLEGQTLFQQQQEQQAGLPQLSADYLGLQNQANQLTTEYLNAIRNREAQGGVAAVVGADQKRIQSQAASDIGLINAQLQAKQGQISLAQNTVDRAISLKYEPIKAQIETGKLFLQQNYDLLSRADKKLADEKNKQWDLQLKQIAKQEEDEKQKEAYIIKASSQNAPQAVIEAAKKAKTTVEAVQALGEYAGDILDTKLKKAQIAKIYADAKKSDTVSGNLTATQVKQVDNSPQGKKLTSLSNLYQLSNTYKKLVDTYGFKAAGKEKSLIDSAYADLKIAYKEAANLGALTGPDVTILEEAIKPSAGGAIKYLNYKLNGGKEGISAAITTSLGRAEQEALKNYKQLVTRDPSYVGSEYVRSLISPFATQIENTDLKTVEAGKIIETPDGILLESLGGGKFSPI